PGERADADAGAGVRALLEERARRLGPRPFLTLPEASLTYAETDEVANRAANALTAVGCGTGDVVMARCGNGLPMVATWFACMKLGAVFMPVNPLLRGEPLRRVMAHAGGEVVVCDAGLHAELAAVAPGLPRLRHTLVAGAPVPAGARSWEALVDAAPSRPPAPPPDDAAAATKLMYTSGTTGVPKGVVWSRACEATWARCYGEELVPLAEGETVYCCLPLSHVTCQGTTLAALWNGAHVSVDSAFDPYGFWRRVRAAGAVAFTYVGTILSVLGRRPPQPDDADNPVRRALGAGAPASGWRAFERRFGLTIVDVWGQTETASCWTMPERLPQRPGTVGRPAPRFEARLVADGGGEAAVGEGGELWIRPHRPLAMFSGYLGEDGALLPPWDGDGWYHTGDLMRRHADGALSFLGRRRDAIRRRGEMIAADDVEAGALAHPGVLEAAAVGVPAEDEADEEVKLCVVPRPGAVLDPVELHGFLREQLPRFMVPRFLDVRAELPKTPTTRVQKYLLRDEGTEGCWDARPALRRRGPARAPGP
ncbi:MAG: AMP-binding protein, partial [Actinomycetota bacterium]|nr:AMP-binding protein [Actinomycetota bacterium]